SRAISPHPRPSQEPVVGAEKAHMSAVRRRLRFATPTISMLLSMAIHAALLLTLGAVVWRTVSPAAAPGNAGVKMVFESGPAPPGTPVSAGAAAPPVAAPPHPSEAYLEPLLAPGASD